MRLPVARSTTRREPGRILEATSPSIFDWVRSIESGPMSPHSRSSAQRPERTIGRVSVTSRLSSSGGPYLPVSLRIRSASLKPSLRTSGSIVSVSKKMPWPVPWLCRKAPATERISQKLCALRFLNRHEP